MFGHHTIRPDAERLTEIYKQWRGAVKVIADVQGIRPSFVINLLPKTAATVAKNNGIGNIFGLDDFEPLTSKFMAILMFSLADLQHRTF